MLANSLFITGVFPINLGRNFIPFFCHDTVVGFHFSKPYLHLTDIQTYIPYSLNTIQYFK
jgi:hypothetical protein